MKSIKDLLKNGILLSDGAMSTYYHDIGGTCERAELASIEQPSLIEQIHKSYIEAGADFIRTDTFAANTNALNCTLDEIKRIISAAYDIAKRSADGKEVAIFSSIGPIAGTSDLTEYKAIVDIWLELGADTFMLETFIEPQTPLRLAEYIRSKNKDAYVHTSFSLTDTGYTKNSYYCGQLMRLANESPYIDSVGFNCGVGPMHMQSILSKASGFEKPVFAMPNAGYPEMINGKVCYVLNPEYFAATLAECVRYGVKAIGGCCGTTPKHIALLRQQLKGKNAEAAAPRAAESLSEEHTIKQSTLKQKLDKGEFVIAVELDPPFKPDCKKLIDGGRLLKQIGVDIVTIADSPMGKSRVDSVITSLKLKREAGVDVLPHICCRDKNAVALRSSLLGAYMEGIRNILVVTGDPVPGEFRGDIKSVFNMTSFTLIDMISQMNRGVFEEGEVFIGGAVNFNVKNKSAELKRLIKKHKNGADFFLTQPIYDDETIDFIKSLPRDRDYKILAGIMPPVSYKNIMFLNNELAGVTIPDELVKRFTSDMTREAAQLVGEDIACEIIAKVKPYVDGLYIIAPFNRCTMIESILKKCNL